MMHRPIADLHSDLLCYLQQGKKHTAFDEISRCSIPQMHAGNVRLQTLAILSDPFEQISQEGWEQVEIFRTLPEKYPDTFEIIKDANQLNHLFKEENKIGILLAIEGASALCDDHDDLNQLFERINTIEQSIGKIVYISLTWYEENRYGGGNTTNIGLKDDGKTLLDFLHQKQIAIDFSHTCDPLAYDILDYIDTHNLEIPVLASHSNFRAVKNTPRNLPDDIAKEIIKRDGIIGLNFVKSFIGDRPENLIKHIEHGKKLGGLKHLCFSADFFYEGLAPPSYQKKIGEPYFSGYSNASCYPAFMDIIENGSVSKKDLDNLAFKNLQHYLQRKIFNRKL